MYVKMYVSSFDHFGVKVKQWHSKRLTLSMKFDEINDSGAAGQSDVPEAWVWCPWSLSLMSLKPDSLMSLKPESDVPEAWV